MAMNTKESLAGFIASDPQLTETAKGDPRFYAQVGQKHFRREDDGTWTHVETTRHNLVMFGKSAEHAHEKFQRGDEFIAQGYVREVNYTDRNGVNVEDEEFVARRIGHDSARTRYDVDRTPRQAAGREAPAREAPGFEPQRQQQREPAASVMGA